MAAENTPAASISIIGMGSSLGADQLGLLAARELDTTAFRKRYPDKLVDIGTCLSPALLARQCIPGRTLILLDAYCSDDPVASVRHFSIHDLETVRRPASSHGFDIRQALALSHVLNEDNPPVAVIGICVGAKPDVTDTRTPGAILKMALPTLLHTIDNTIRNLSPT